MKSKIFGFKKLKSNDFGIHPAYEIITVSTICLYFHFADNIIDGSFMGMVLAICLSMVLGAAFFAYKNLYFAVMQKMYPDRGGEL